MKLSWLDPGRYADELVGDWDEDEETPLPAALDQDQLDTCIPYSVHTTLTGQGRVMAKRANQHPPPRFSLHQLVMIFFELPLKQRTIYHLLLKIHYEGIVADSDFNGGRPPRLSKRHSSLIAPGATRYYIDFACGYDPNPDIADPEEYLMAVRAFDETVEDELRKFPLVAEIQVDIAYTKSRDILYRLNRNSVDRKKLMGHAITLTGWGTSTVDHQSNVWEYLNSYGEHFGRGGYGEVVKTDLHFVYGATIRQWWRDPIVPQPITQRNWGNVAYREEE